MLTDVAGQVTNLAERLFLLNAWITQLGVTGELHLYQAPITAIGPDIVLADLVEATFSGYAEEALTGQAVAQDINGTNFVSFGDGEFTHNGGGTAESIIGYYLVNATDSALLLVERFPEPVPMEANGDKIQIAPRIPVPSAGPDALAPN